MSNLSYHEKYRVITDLLTHILLEPKYAFIAPIGVGSKLVIGSGVTQIAATDGLSLYIEEPFFDFDKDAREAILVHEMLHVFLGHTFRRGDRDPTMWNVAGDFIVNDNVIRTFNLHGLPKGTLYDPKYQDWATEQVYESLDFDQKMKDQLLEELADAHRELERKGLAPHQPGQGKPGQQGKPQPGQGKAPGQGQEPGGGGGQPSEAQVKGGFNGSDVFETPKDQQGEVEAKIRDGFNKGYGSMPGGIRAYVKEWLFPELPWQALLARFMDNIVKENYRFGPFRRAGMYRKVYLPTQYEEAIKVAVAIDTSGSVGDEMVGKFLNEVKAISELNGVSGYMIPVTEHIEHIFEFPPFPSNQDIDQYIQTGGTDFRPPFEYIRNELDDDINAMVYLTDGMGPYPEVQPPYPVLWVLSINPAAEGYYPPFGEVIYIPSATKF